MMRYLMNMMLMATLWLTLTATSGAGQDHTVLSIERPSVATQDSLSLATSLTPEVSDLLDFQLLTSSYRQLLGSQPTTPVLGPKFQNIGAYTLDSAVEVSQLNMQLGVWSLEGEQPLSLALTSNYWQRQLPLTPAGLGWDGESRAGAGLGLGMTIRPVDVVALEISGHNLMGEQPSAHWSDVVTPEWSWFGSRYWQLKGALIPVPGWSLSLGYRQQTDSRQSQYLLSSGLTLNDAVSVDLTGAMDGDQALEAMLRTRLRF